MEGKDLSGPLRTIEARATEWLILRSLRKQFRGIWLREQAWPAPGRSTILFANHHYWWDGYFAFLLRRHWQIETGMVWMSKMRAFPPFGTLGAMPFPADNVRVRMGTIRRTMRTLKDTPSILMLMPEGQLHEAPSLFPFQRSLVWLHRQLPEVDLLPAAIEVVQGIGQYPDVYMTTGDFFRANETDEQAWLDRAKEEVERLLASVDTARAQSPDEFKQILEGKKSAHERWKCSGDKTSN